MQINDEMMACYVEGKLNIEERNFVRKYLSKHPEKLETVMYMMDDLTECCSDETDETENIISMVESSFSDIAYSAAAFVPQQKKVFTFDKKKVDIGDDFLGRLETMCDEIGL